MTTATNHATSSPAVSCDQALQVARVDAEKVYRNLERFRIEIVLEPDGWHIEYWLKDPNVQGGGPHYIVDAATGAIVSKKYYQ